MRPRQELTEIFSTFIQFEADRFSRWVRDARLHRNAQNHINQLAAASISEDVLALCWHQTWQDPINPLPKLHLSAYLQEPCYWAAQQTQRKYTNPQYNGADYFQLAIAELDSILKSFNPGRGSSLSAYARIAFTSRLRDILRQRREIDGVTTWTLLRSRITRKGLVEALHHAGFSTPEIDQYWLAWVCFKTVYTPTQEGIKRLPDPDRILWEAAAKLYNTERQNQLRVPGSPCSPEMIEQWMRKAATCVRAYLHPAMTSLNPAGGEGQEIDLPDPQATSGLDAIALREELETRLDQQQQVFNLLTMTVEQLLPEMQTILRLYYQQNQTQQQIAAHLSISQPTVVRRLTKARESLLTALMKWRDRKSVV